MNMQVSISEIKYITATEKKSLHKLHSNFFDNSLYSTFCKDFEEKDWVILARDEHNEFAGFSTIQSISLTFNDEPVDFMFSGDTIIAPTAWHSNVLAPAIGVFQSWFIDNRPNRKCFWFLICKGYRTYRSLPVFYHTFFPRYNTQIPELESLLLKSIATHKFGNHYNHLTNIISFESQKDFLCKKLQEIPDGKDLDPHVVFFLNKNPDFTRGNELACITRLSYDNFNKVARRVIKSGEKLVTWNIQ